MWTPYLIDALRFFVLFCFFSLLWPFFVHYFIVWENCLPQPVRVIKSKLKKDICSLPWNTTSFKAYICSCFVTVFPTVDKNRMDARHLLSLYAYSRRKIALLAPVPWSPSSVCLRIRIQLLYKAPHKIKHK